MIRPPIHNHGQGCQNRYFVFDEQFKSSKRPFWVDLNQFLNCETMQPNFSRFFLSLPPWVDSLRVLMVSSIIYTWSFDRKKNHFLQPTLLASKK